MRGLMTPHYCSQQKTSNLLFLIMLRFTTILSLCISFSTTSEASTVLSSGDHGKANESFPDNWGSNVTATGDGGDPDGRAIVTGSATPNISVAWGGNDATNWQFWDFTSGPNWAANEAIQLDNMANGDTRTITFTPVTGVTATIHSFRWIGWENQMGQTVNITVTGTTSGELYNQNFTLTDSQDTTVDLNSTGAEGEPLTLTFTRTNTTGNNNNIAITDITFSQSAPITTNSTILSSADNGLKNNNVSGSFGSNVSSSGNGGDSNGRAIITGTGTPNIALGWGGNDTPSWQFWDDDASPNWGGNEAIQLDGMNNGDTRTVTFTPTFNADVEINSFRWLGWESGMGQTVNVKVTGPTSGELYNQDFLLSISQDELVAINQKGSKGEVLTLTFTRTNTTGSGGNIAITDLTFSETITPETVTVTTKVLSGDAEECDRYGDAVATDRLNQMFIAGAPMEDTQGEDAGAAYIVSLESGNQLHKLIASDGAVGDSFGQAVAISGSIAVVAAPSDSDNGANSGSVYVFNARTGAQRFKLTASDGESGDLFGWSVSVSGNYIIIGAPGDDDQGTDAGAAYVFSSATGAELRKVIPPASSDEDWFGFSVDVVGGKIVIGSPNDDDGGTNSGAVYVINATDGNQLSKLAAGDAAEDNWFGYSVDLHGDLIGAGAPHESGKGAAYIFHSSTYSQLSKLTAGAAGINDEQLGFSIGISNSHALIGTAANTNSKGALAGTSYLFKLSDFSQQAKLIHADQTAGDYLGTASAISGDAVVLGAPKDSENGVSESGATYVFFIKNAVMDTAFADWVAAYGLTDGNANTGADPNGDGISNLESYAFDLDPSGSGARFITPTTGKLSDTGTSFDIEFTIPASERPDLRYIIEQSTDLTLGAAGWSEIKRKEGNAAWTGAATVDSTNNIDGSTTIRISSTLPLSSTPKANLRVKFELIP